MSKAVKGVKAMVRHAEAQAVKLVRPLGCGGFALLKDGHWFEFKSRREMARWLKRAAAEKGAR